MDELPCRVLYLNHSAKPSGAEFALWRMLGATDRRRVNPIVLFGEEGPAAELMRGIGVETHVLPLAGNVRDVRKDTLGLGAFMHLGRAAHLLVYAARIAIFARRHQVRIIHTNTIKAHLYGLLVGWMTRLPVIWHLRDYVSEPYFPRAAVRLIRFLARRGPRQIIGVSRSVIQQLRLPDGETSGTVVLDGLTDHELAAEVSPRLRLETGARIRIGIVGRLAEWKGQHVFLDAAAKVATSRDVEFVIVGAPLFGEEDYEQSLDRQAENLGIGHRVSFRGFTRDVAAELRQLDILVHASITDEPFGQVILEGMAVGLPVVASRGGGVPEIITHGETGLLTTMGDADDLAATLLRLLDAPAWARKLGRNGYEHVRTSFRARYGARRVADVYQSILNSPSESLCRTSKPEPRHASEGTIAPGHSL